MWKSALWAVVAAFLTVACADDRSVADHPIGPTTGVPAPLFTASAEGIPGEYIVVLRSDGASRTRAIDVAQSVGAKYTHLYESALVGFAAKLDQTQLDAVRLNPAVSFVEQQQVYSSDAVTVQPIDGVTTNWGLDRIDQKIGLDATYTYNSAAGRGVRAYVIDTGILPTHVEFGGRASVGFDAFGGTGIDCNGHGTHVAGTIGGTSNGVAKKSTLIGVRVLDCGGGGTTATVLAGINWVRKNAVKPAVANMSLGGGFSKALNLATDNLAKTKVPVVTAAGNDNTHNSCVGSPSGALGAINVGAMNLSDFPTNFTSFGRCVDIFAPGQGIISAWPSSDTALAALNGTSMAAPHVAGAVALYLKKFGTQPSTKVEAFLLKNSATNVLGAIDTPHWQYGSPNRLLNTEALE